MLKGLIREKSGNFSITTAFLLVPMLGMAGLAIDFSNVLMAKSAAQNAADAAALGAIAEKSTGVAGSLNAGDGSVALSEADARKIFSGQMSTGTGFSIVSVDATVKKTGHNLVSVFKYVGSVPTTFSRVIGKNSITFSGTATASYDTRTYRNFYLLLDNTPSMGVAATTSDINTMVNNTGDKCAFACHISNNGAQDPNDNFHLAKALGVTIRIDVVAAAVASLMDTATATRSAPDQFGMAIYTFGEKAEDTKLLEVSSVTKDLAHAKSKATDVQLMTIPYQGYNNDQQTSFDTALTQIKDKIGAQGTGNTANDPEKILFFVSDGVGDSYKPSTCTKPTTGGRCQEPIDTKYCEDLKAKNIKIAVLYTTYLPLPTNGWYNTWIAPFQSQITTKMKSCATEGLFFEVSPTQGISDAMNALFLKIINTPRLTS